MSLKVFVSVGTTEFDGLLRVLNTQEVVDLFKRQKVTDIHLQLGR